MGKAEVSLLGNFLALRAKKLLSARRVIFHSVENNYYPPPLGCYDEIRRNKAHWKTLN